MSDDTKTAGKGPGGPFLVLLQGLSGALDWSGRLIAVGCLLVMFVLLFVNVVLRYLGNTGIPWAYEVHALLLPWLVAGGVVIAAARGRNISISLLADLLGAGGRRWLGIGVGVMVAVICLAVLWHCQPILKAAKFQSLATLGIKQVWGYASLVYAFGGMAAIGVIDALRAILWDTAPTSASLS